MSSALLNSSVPRRQLGRELRRLRERLARVPQTTAARELDWSATKLLRMERGEVPIRAEDVVLLCELYGADLKTVEALAALAPKTKEKGWWHDYASIPSWFELFIGLEEAASHLRAFHTELVPGVLQTREYATAVFARSPLRLSPEVIEQRVAVRLQRAQLLTRMEPILPRFDIVLDEALVRRPAGSGAIMAAQLRRLAEASELPNVSIRLIPFSAGIHGGTLSRAFTMLDFPAELEPTTVYVEGLTGALFLDRPDEAERYTIAFDDLTAAALGQAATRDLLARTAKEYES
ncbi:helix-turn-helix transcriptional regulator [Solwaraspora sp. WMMA2080]|uniref:helix-turn-helix domain-containing protein n=1 Tax=unclassified Solwaraspora TaxID=2627926 RepID=UPI00248CDAB8|nr:MULTISPECIES: helix-turn-helix transcriptional regulator [unclassified Solwaraspora]WBB97379.1 helix-turn-helix transcriptional regulator [Solwaraspora sp. WMMA2059]WBC18718.1 helix-turn-helix transcriptional regulator [Solwaraspora sp. WMMA2080]